MKKLSIILFSFLAGCSSDPVNMDEVFNSSKKINVFDIGDKWIDIGHINDFKKAYNEIKNW